MGKSSLVQCDFPEEVIKQKDLLFCIIYRSQSIIKIPNGDKFPRFCGNGSCTRVRCR
jgi:hypothetical protein